MIRPLVRLVWLFAMLGSSHTVSAHPVERPDQRFTPSSGEFSVAENSGGDEDPLANIAAFAQTFTVRSPRFLTGVDVTFVSSMQSYTVGIFRVEAGLPAGPPDFSEALVSVTVEGLPALFPTLPHPTSDLAWLRVDFGTAVRVKRGDELALVFTGVLDNGHSGVASWRDSSGGYGRGAAFDWALSSEGSFWRELDGDLAFRTFTSPSLRRFGHKPFSHKPFGHGLFRTPAFSTEVPEPPALAMLLVSLVLLSCARRLGNAQAAS